MSHIANPFVVILDANVLYPFRTRDVLLTFAQLGLFRARITDDIMDEYSKQDALFNEVYTSRKNYMKKAREWTKISEFDYIKTSQMVK